MMIQTHHAIAGGLLTLSTLACPAPQPTQLDHPDTPCPPHRAVLMHYYDSSTLTCDPDGSQILVTTIDDDPGPNQEILCNNSGGQVLYDPTNDRFYCIDIDY